MKAESTLPPAQPDICGMQWGWREPARRVGPISCRPAAGKTLAASCLWLMSGDKQSTRVAARRPGHSPAKRYPTSGNRPRAGAHDRGVQLKRLTNGLGTGLDNRAKEPTMARTDDDTWDLASSVGATATLVAAARAAATRSDKPLINDPFAGPLVEAVGIDMFTRMVRGEINPAELDDEQARGVRTMTDNMAARTKFFDEFFLDATAAGIRQAVILASGLDARAYRLPWPAGTVVYEVDQPQVIEFKTTALAKIGAEPTAHRRTVAIDLRRDWPTALSEA